MPGRRDLTGQGEDIGTHPLVDALEPPMGFLPHHIPSLCSSRRSVYPVRGLTLKGKTPGERRKGLQPGVYLYITPRELYLPRVNLWAQIGI